MNNLNVVSTPNINGNIGSCQSNTISTVSGRNSIFTENTINTITNSCTGEVKEFYSWGFTGFSFIGFIILAVIAIIAINAFFDKFK